MENQNNDNLNQSNVNENVQNNGLNTSNTNTTNNTNMTPNNSQYMDLGDKTISAVENFMNTTDTAGEYTDEDRKKNKANALLCYIPFVVFYFIFTGKSKNSKYLSFHSNQGLLVTFLYIVSFIITALLEVLFKKDSFIRNDIPGWVGFISYILYCISFLSTLFGIINTSNESSKELPIIGKFRILK